MALTEETIQDKIEIVGDFKHVQVRTATVIKRDGTEISRSFSRHVVAPLIQAVKDQQATIDAQQTTITALEARITALENAE